MAGGAKGMQDVRTRLPMVAALLASLALTASAEASSVLEPADAPAAQLDRVETEQLEATDVIHYAQEVGGVPVTGAGVVVADGPGEPPEVLFDESVAGIEAPGDPAVSRADAVAAALAAIGSPRGGNLSARLVIDSAHGNQLAWEVTHADSRPISDWRVLVSAADGSIIAKTNLLRHATGDARLFEPNAVVENDGYGRLADRGDRDTNKLTNLRSQVTLHDLTDGQSCLKGEWANVRMTFEERKVCRDDLDWSNTRRASNRFEALMAYYHVTEIQRYIQTLDLPMGVNEESQRVLVNTISADQSFYSPSADELQFGTGGVDDGEDGDVIAHEYGHAVQFAQKYSAFATSKNQTNAMGEGFGDYLAAVHQDELVGPDPEWTPCIMEWDAISYDFDSSDGICLRRADDPSHRDQQARQCFDGLDFHCWGQVWSSALLELREDLGVVAGDTVMDRLVLASHETLPPEPSFKQGAEAIMAADEALYAGAHCGELSAEFVERRFFDQFSC
jgi:Zn-dependent metalloprotease